MFDGKAFGQQIVEAVKAHMATEIGPLLRRIDELEKRLAEQPEPIRGIDGKNGIDGAPGEKGADGANGRDGKDGLAGRGIAKSLIDAKGHMIVTYTDGSTDDVGLVVGKDGRDGVDGKDGAMGADGRDGIDGAAGQPGMDGKDGADGKSVDAGAVAVMIRDQIEEAGIAEMIQKAVDAIPRPKDGKDGADGRDGEKGAPGERGEQGEAGAPGADGKDGRDGVDGQNGKDGADGAPGRDGIDGKDGAQGERGLTGEKGERGDRGEAGLPGERGEKGADGKDGVGLADAFIDDENRLVLTMTDGRVKTMKCVVGKSGADGAPGSDGRDGKDGLGFEDLHVAYDGRRSFKIKFERGDQVKEYAFKLPTMLDCGTFELGKRYDAGDGVTHGGSYWIATKDGVTEKPGEGDGWRLAVKKGKDMNAPVRYGKQGGSDGDN